MVIKQQPQEEDLAVSAFRAQAALGLPLPRETRFQQPAKVILLF